MVFENRSELVNWYNSQPEKAEKCIVINGVDIKFQQIVFFNDAMAFMNLDPLSYVGGVHYADIKDMKTGNNGHAVIDYGVKNWMQKPTKEGEYE